MAESALSGQLFFLNPAIRSENPSAGLFTPEEYARVAEFFRSLPGYAATPLLSLPGYAAELGLEELLIKDESKRLGRRAFKILGVSYAVHRLLREGAIGQGAVLACATDGNHGCALAAVARQFELRSKVFIHRGASPARVRAIADEGAEVILVAGNYDTSVHEAAEAARKNGWTLVSDTAWPGYEVVPQFIMAGYTMLMTEAAGQWGQVPDVVLVQAGVGGLAGAVVSWLQHNCGEARPSIVCCEPVTAACVLESMRAGRPQVLAGSLDTVMAGLSCGTVSSIAWPVLQDGVDACVAVCDDECLEVVRRLAHPRAGEPQIVAGESGACGLTALSSILSRDDLLPVRERLRLGSHSRAFVINTEGATDPESYYRATGLRPQ